MYLGFCLLVHFFVVVINSRNIWSYPRWRHQRASETDRNFLESQGHLSLVGGSVCLSVAALLQKGWGIPHTGVADKSAISALGSWQLENQSQGHHRHHCRYEAILSHRRLFLKRKDERWTQDEVNAPLSTLGNTLHSHFRASLDSAPQGTSLPRMQDFCFTGWCEPVDLGLCVLNAAGGYLLWQRCSHAANPAANWSRRPQLFVFNLYKGGLDASPDTSPQHAEWLKGTGRQQGKRELCCF